MGAPVDGSRITRPDEDGITAAARHLSCGGIVGYPTETVFGLAVDPFDEGALDRLFSLKGRPPDRPVLLLIEKPGDLYQLTPNLPDPAHRLIDRHWPGPLTLVLPAVVGLSSFVTSNSGTVAVRQASPGPALDLVTRFGHPITSTSANPTGQPPSTSSHHVATWADPGVLILEGTCDPDATPSTLVDVTAGELRILREGAVPSSDILT